MARRSASAGVAEAVLDIKEKYEARDGRRLSNKDAKLVGQILERLHAKFGGVTASLVVEEARNPKSLLHKFFDWDDGTAAEKYRLGQARALIRSVNVVIELDHQPARQIQAFVRVERADGAFYSPTMQVMKHASYREQVVARALRDLQSWRNRYKDVQELAAIFEALDQSSKKVKV